MAVELVVGGLSDEGPVFRENLVVFGVAGKFVEPIAACECVFPYFRTTESLEVLDPHVPVYLLNVREGRHSCDVRPGQCDEPNIHASFVNLGHGSSRSFESRIFGIALFASLWVYGSPSDF